MVQPGELLDYLEVIGKGQPLKNEPLPYIAVPTTAGTGAEATRNAVLASSEHAMNMSLRSPMMFPAMAILDPELTYGLPRSVTATTGMDALTQLIEPYLCTRSNIFTDALCQTALRTAPNRFFVSGMNRKIPWREAIWP